MSSPVDVVEYVTTQRLRGLVHELRGRAGHVPATTRTWLRTWHEVWESLRVPPPLRVPCAGRVHGWLVDGHTAVLRGKRGRTFWVVTPAAPHTSLTSLTSLTSCPAAAACVAVA